VNFPSVDLHCHLDLYQNSTLIAAQCRKAGTYVLSVTTTPRAWRGTAQLAMGNARIKTALGLHPQIAHERLDELPLFDMLLPATRYIGEIGLDGGPQWRSHWRAQMHVFEHILASSSRAGGRIITIHSRRAATAVLDALARYPDAGIPVLHWFSGSKSELSRAIDMGCWFSVGPGMVQSKRGRELVRLMPLDRVVTETDGPFDFVGGRPLEPGEVDGARNALSLCWRTKPEEVAARVLASFRRLVSSAVGGAA